MLFWPPPIVSWTAGIDKALWKFLQIWGVWIEVQNPTLENIYNIRNVKWDLGSRLIFGTIVAKKMRFREWILINNYHCTKFHRWLCIDNARELFLAWRWHSGYMSSEFLCLNYRYFGFKISVTSYFACVRSIINSLN